MAKCANCVKDADYVYTITDDVKTNYCATHMPKALLSGKVAGVEQLLPSVAEAVQAVAKATKKTVVESSPAPEVVEAPTDAPD